MPTNRSKKTSNMLEGVLKYRKNMPTSFFEGPFGWIFEEKVMLHAVGHLGIYMTGRWRWLTIAMYLWRKLERATPAHKCTVCIIFQFIWLEFNCAWQYTRKRWYRQIFHMHLLIFKLHTKAEACIGTYRL